MRPLEGTRRDLLCHIMVVLEFLAPNSLPYKKTEPLCLTEGPGNRNAEETLYLSLLIFFSLL